MQWRELEPGDNSRPLHPAEFSWAELPVAPRPPDTYGESCALLGVDVASTPDEIHSAYRSLVLRHHPDRACDADRETAEERLKAINTAYSHLQQAIRIRHI